MARMTFEPGFIRFLMKPDDSKSDILYLSYLRPKKLYSIELVSCDGDTKTELQTADALHAVKFFTELLP